MSDEYARDRAIEHLAEALYLLNGIRPETDPGEALLRLSIAPAEDPARCHSFDLTAKQIEGLADAIDSMNAYLEADRMHDMTVDTDSLNRRKAEFVGWLEGQAGEEIASGEFSAAAVAQCTPDLYADVTDVFDDIDPISLLDDVLNSANPGDSAVAYEDLVTGETDGGI